jgi:quercetin dioxygenase-like cupin family protein
MRAKALLAVSAALLVAACTGSAPDTGQAAPKSVVRQVLDEPTNVPGKSLVGVSVSYPPGAKNAAHHHARSAFIMAYVISGLIRSQVEGEAMRVYRAGETWKETPGAHHLVSENASATEPAELLAVFLVDTGDQPLTTDDVPAAGS